MTRVLRSSVALAAVAAAMTVSACSADGSVSPSTASPAVRDLDRWSLPLDPYIDKSVFDESYAEQVLIAPCLSGHGIDWPVAYQPRTDGSNGTTNAAGRTLFNRTSAAQFGYHQAQTFDQPGFEEAKAISDRPVRFTPEQDAVFVDCLDEARERLGTETMLPPVASSLGADAYDGALSSKSVRDASARWAECMSPLAITDIGSKPTDMPSDSLASDFGLDGDGDASPRPSAREIAIAISDADCQISSGYAQAFYDEEWSRQEQLVADNSDELSRALASIEAKAERIDEVLAEHAPERP